MKALVTIGHQTFLFPSENEATKAIALLSKALCVRDATYRGVLEVEETYPPEISMKMLVKPFKLCRQDSDTPVELPQKNGAKKKGGAGRLALPAQRKQHMLTLE